jgi:hypothetical protein
MLLKRHRWSIDAVTESRVRAGAVTGAGCGAHAAAEPGTPVAFQPPDPLTRKEPHPPYFAAADLTRFYRPPPVVRPISNL